MRGFSRSTLRLLLDENMSQEVAIQVRRHRPTIAVESVHTWRGGEFEGHSDKTLLLAARSEELALVTYDQATIPEVLNELRAEEVHHAGVIFVDSRTIPNSDFGTLTRAIIVLWDRFGHHDWRDRVAFLGRPPRT